jgi:putative transposase
LRAGDQDGYILDEIVRTHGNTKAARRRLMRLLKKQGCPHRRMIADKLALCRRSARDHANG